MPVKAMNLNIQFDITHTVGNSVWGVIKAIDNSDLHKALESIKGTLGVSEIDVRDYQTYLKKKKTSSYSRPPEPRTHQTSPRPRKEAVSVVEGGDDSEADIAPENVKGRTDDELEATADSIVSNAPVFVTNQKDLATELDVAFNELRKYFKLPEFPAKTDDGYNVSECREYVEAQRKK